MASLLLVYDTTTSHGTIAVDKLIFDANARDVYKHMYGPCGMHRYLCRRLLSLRLRALFKYILNKLIRTGAGFAT